MVRIGICLDVGRSISAQHIRSDKIRLLRDLSEVNHSTHGLIGIRYFRM